MIVYTEIEGDWNYIVKHIPRYHENKQTNKQNKTKQSKTKQNKQASKQASKQTYIIMCVIYLNTCISYHILKSFKLLRQLLWCPNTVGYW